MRKLFAILAAILASNAWADSYFINGDGTDVIITLCVPELNGEGCLHIDEDVSGLEIEVIAADGTSDALYDAGTEIEDVAAPGTGAHTDPSANNVRVSPTGRSLDTTEFQFADAVFDGAEIKTLCVNDAQTTIMDSCWQIFWVLDSTDNQADVTAALGRVSTTIATLASQTSFTLTAGSGDDDAYNRCHIMITDASTDTQIAYGDILDYTGSSKTVTLAYDPGIFTMATSDLVAISCLK